MAANCGVEFFEKQFQRQVSAHEFTLNPFEEAALPCLTGRVLDLGLWTREPQRRGSETRLRGRRRGCEPHRD